MKLTDFGRLAASDYRQFERQINSLPQRRAIWIDDCELPPGSTPARATLSFHKESAARYVMCLDREVSYSGDNRAMQALCEDMYLQFPSFAEMKQFFQALPSEPAQLGPEEGEVYDLDTVVDMDQLTPPSGATQPAPDYQTIQRELLKSIMGQETAVETIAHQTALHLNKIKPKKPLSIVAYGPPGTGKSESAKALAGALSKLSPHKYATVWTELNTFTEPHTVYRLIGSPPGYVGYNDSPVLEAVTHNSYTVFIFDEIEKAHPDVIKVFMSILDEGRCSARKELADGSREFNFKHCIFFFTSNLRLGEAPKGKIGFSLSDDVMDIRGHDDAIEVSYRKDQPEDEHTALTKRIYRDTEAARRAFVATGVLREIASRFNCFVEFRELSAEAKIRILAKQVIETGFEYNIRLTYISSAILQSLIDAATSENALTVRSFKSVIEGCLAVPFAAAGARYGGQTVRLKGTMEEPMINPA